MSEHDDCEDKLGRHSMWHAFDRSSERVALILKPPLDPGTLQFPRLFIRPVAYFSETELGDELDRVITNVEANQDFLRSLPLPGLAAFLMLMMTVVCLKREKYKDEKEWRVIYMPKLFSSASSSPFSSPLISRAPKVLDGVPQTVYKIPLNGTSPGFDIPNLVDRIIVGPNSYPLVMKEAFVKALSEAGMSDAEDRVVVSDIPIRT